MLSDGEEVAQGRGGRRGETGQVFGIQVDLSAQVNSPSSNYSNLSTCPWQGAHLFSNLYSPALAFLLRLTSGKGGSEHFALWSLGQKPYISGDSGPGVAAFSKVERTSHLCT